MSGTHTRDYTERRERDAPANPRRPHMHLTSHRYARDHTLGTLPHGLQVGHLESLDAPEPKAPKMNRPLAPFAPLPALFVLASLLTVGPSVPALAAGDSTAGAMLVQSNGCAGCHGANFQGGTAPKLYGIEHRRSAAEIAGAIANPKAPMPKFPLDPAQIADVVAYLSSLDGGRGGAGPVATLEPAKPSSHATLTVRFPGAAPRSVTAEPAMEMGGSTMRAAKVELKPTSDPHVWQGKVSFSMGGPWTIEVTYDGKHLTVPVNVAGSM